MLVFMALWSLCLRADGALGVVAGWLARKLGVLGFAGGTMVHINASVTSLACVIMLGGRKGNRSIFPHNLALTITGAALLWVAGLINAGSALSG
jgi:Amt family ammonium transporter